MFQYIRIRFPMLDNECYATQTRILRTTCSNTIFSIFSINLPFSHHKRQQQDCMCENEVYKLFDRQGRPPHPRYISSGRCS